MAEWAATFTVEFVEQDEFCACFGEVIQVDHDYDPYEGPYIVTPKFTDQILATKDKNMEDDVTVLTIPLAQVTTVGGGFTVTIGG